MTSVILFALALFCLWMAWRGPRCPHEKGDLLRAIIGNTMAVKHTKNGKTVILTGAVLKQNPSLMASSNEGTMKKLIIGLVALLAAPTMAMAQTVDTSGLTPQQVAEIQAQVEAKRTETPEGQVRASIARANEWVDIGEGIGAGVAAAARETGQVVNEFAQTPVGKMTTFVILYKVVGKDVIGLIIGSIVMIAFTTIWIIYTYSTFSKEKRVRIEDKVKTIEYSSRPWTEGRVGMALLSAAVFLFVNGLLLGTVVL